MNNKKEKILTIVGILVLCLALVSGTFAYFSAQAGGTTTRDVSVTSNTTDNLAFSISNDISFTASTANFYQGGNNAYGDATATVTLTPNNKTNQATMNYYMYLNLTSNPTVYSTGNTNEDAELILQVFDGSNQLVTLTGLGSQVALDNGYGYDITGKEGLITLLDNHAITANGSTATENWHVVITLVNLNLDQNDNAGKTITGEVIMQKEAISVEPQYVYWNDNFSGVTYASTSMPTEIGLNGVYDSRELLASAVDNAYTGESPNNYHFADNPIYIRTSVDNGTPTGQEVCLWYNNAEFCLGTNYWVGDAQDEIDGSTTMAKLKADMEEKLGITLYNSDSEAESAGHSGYYCYSNTDDVYCNVSDFHCSVNSYGSVRCDSDVTFGTCSVYSDGSAICYY